MEASRAPSGRRCVAANCSNRAGGGITVHNFPTNARIRQQWIRFVRAKRAKWNASNYSVLCSAHFKEDDFPLKYRLQCYTEVAGVKGRRPLPEAVPTIHVTEDHVESSPTVKRGAVHKRTIFEIMKQFEDSAEVDEESGLRNTHSVERDAGILMAERANSFEIHQEKRSPQSSLMLATRFNFKGRNKEPLIGMITDELKRLGCRVLQAEADTDDDLVKSAVTKSR
ncbi:hypothetical protein CAPTEDRAFT_204093 [Capitella teleta]|uniref:THAP-type domain-containing protein n=1 Tax=Capitella teleta TaxID=283909 RepID=R7UU83_CAPTE|nr:hypothetical protein CAPTEDRAFT_204093 [Capitella teleta]|eukprot:ELU07482.1 hypothetical protein CAPTEDRAFT_204093 [Capitella teleta]